MKHEDIARRIQVSLRMARERSWREVPLPVWIVLGAIAVYILLKMTAPGLSPIEPRERSWFVSTMTVDYQDIQPRQVVFGQIVAGRETELRALVAGRVVDTGPGFREGGVVAAGALLLQIDPFDSQASLDDARARLREANARLKTEQDGLKINRQQFDLSRRDHERAVRLHEKGTVSRKFLDNAALALSRSELEVSARTNRIEMEEARVQQLEVAVRRARRALSETKLVAPFDGFIRDVGAELGKRVSINDRVATISDSGRLEVNFNITDSQYGRILAAGEKVIGRDVTAIWHVGGDPLEYRAVVSRVGAEIEASSGGIDLYAELVDAPAEVILRPGAFVEVSFPDRKYKAVARVPERAVFEGKRAYVIIEHRLHVRAVEVLGYVGDDVLIRGALKQGDTLLTTRFAEVGEGVLVETGRTP